MLREMQDQQEDFEIDMLFMSSTEDGGIEEIRTIFTMVEEILVK